MYPNLDIAADPDKACGDCTACCSLMAIPELDKPHFAACKHLCKQGCSIYESRPDTCRDYTCLWRADIVKGDERRRPDILGVVFHVTVIHRKPQLEIWEIKNGAAKSRQVQYLLRKLMATGKYEDYHIVPANQTPGESVQALMRFVRIQGEWRFDKLVPDPHFLGRKTAEDQMSSELA